MFYILELQQSPLCLLILGKMPAALQPALLTSVDMQEQRELNQLQWLVTDRSHI